MKEEKIILPNSDQAAKFVTNISGWVDRNGRFFGKDERAARYSGSTHNLCDECGSVCGKNRTHCDLCAEKRSNERHALLTQIEWDGEGFVYSDTLNEYFDLDGLNEYLEENKDETSESLRLFNCEPNYLSEVNEEFWCDELGEDQELPDSVIEALNVLSEVIDKLPPINYEAGKKRVIYKP